MLCLTVNLYKLKLANYLQFCLTEGQKKQLISTDFNWLKWKRKFGLLVEVKEALAKVMLPAIWAFCWLRRGTM